MRSYLAPSPAPSPAPSFRFVGSEHNRPTIWATSQQQDRDPPDGMTGIIYFEPRRVEHGKEHGAVVSTPRTCTLLLPFVPLPPYEKREYQARRAPMMAGDATSGVHECTEWRKGGLLSHFMIDTQCGGRIPVPGEEANSRA